MKIGICGGTFDPIHRGHLDPILSVREAMAWDRVLYVPAFVQPFKTDRTTVSPYHRFAMVALATEGHEELYTSPQELERGAISYTVDTLQQLRSAYPQATLDWVIGEDNVEQLLEWKSIDTILELGNFAVLTRTDGGAAAASAAGTSGRFDERSTPGAVSGRRATVPGVLASRVTTASERGTHGAIVFAGNSVIPISSTEVRRRVRAGEPIEDLVGPRVSRYIQHYDLYRKGQS
jgi:nicotinate-nucleotide adenylyltransferase